MVNVKDLEAAVRIAIIYGYKRVDPKKAWSNIEQREAAVRWLLEQYLNTY